MTAKHVQGLPKRMLKRRFKFHGILSRGERGPLYPSILLTQPLGFPPEPCDSGGFGLTSLRAMTRIVLQAMDAIGEARNSYTDACPCVT
jgi:hypothetical protein